MAMETNLQINDSFPGLSDGTLHLTDGRGIDFWSLSQRIGDLGAKRLSVRL